MKKICDFCKKEYETKTSKSKFCSNECKFKSRSEIYKYSDIEFMNIVKSSKYIGEIIKNLGVRNSNPGRIYETIRKRIVELNIDTSHFIDTSKLIKENNTKYDLDEILVENSTYKNISRLKKRIVEANLLKYKCSICGNKGIWNNKPLTLQLDHINGVNNDHRIQNLRFICPNCHSQTDTFTGRNNKNG